MNDLDDYVSSRNPAQLAELFHSSADSRGGWRSEELADVLRHQLDAPLVFDVGRASVDSAPVAYRGSDSPTRAAQSAPTSEDGPALRSFRDLLRHPAPPVGLLRLTKDFAKSSDRREDAPLPPKIATALYYAAIITALLRHRSRISDLSLTDVTGGARWAISQRWMEPDARSVFVEWMNKSADFADCFA